MPVLSVRTDKPNTRGSDPKRDGLKNRAVVSMEGRCPLKAARTGASSVTRRLEGIPAPHRQGSEDKEVRADQQVIALDVRDSEVLSLAWENQYGMAYVRQESKFLDGRRFGALPSHEQAPKNLYAGRFRTTV